MLIVSILIAKRITHPINTLVELFHELSTAGEHGRGFSVVAEEVRLLAEESETATMEISQILNNINLGVEEVVQQISDAAYIAKIKNSRSKH